MQPAPGTDYPTDKRNYQIVWAFMPDQWSHRISSHPSSAVLPIFLGADVWRAYEETNEYQSEPQWCALGILYTWTETGKWAYPMPDVLDAYRRDLLAGIANQLGYPSLPAFIVACAAWVRWNCGCLRSQIVLGGGMFAVPDTVLIQYDFMLDTWSLVERAADMNRMAVCKSLISLFRNMDLTQLRSAKPGQPGVNTVCYIYLASLLLSGDRAVFMAEAPYLFANVMQAPNMSRKLEVAAGFEKLDISHLQILQGPERI